jgi:hypothetical protein
LTEAGEFGEEWSCGFELLFDCEDCAEFAVKFFKPCESSASATKSLIIVSIYL